ncbi:hypothetical protein ACF1BP_27880 [Streptomyces sp. NPDC014735]|uniref:hypothetical protein n=1 Tax=unclassified Streptomyces TaxID=2593676 RepID=UPI0036F8005E
MDQSPAAAWRVGITAVGSCLPERVLTSEDLLGHVTEPSRLPLPPRMFERSSGSLPRRVAAGDEYASTLTTAHPPSAARPVLWINSRTPSSSTSPGP